MMTITIHNYEAYMLDYLEGTISRQDKEMLLLFLEQHPELKEDLEVDPSLTLNSPEATTTTFDLKDTLKKHPAQEYDLLVKDYLYIKHAEEGLTDDENAELILVEPELEKREEAKRLYKELRLRVSEGIIYPLKKSHKRLVLLPGLKRNQLMRIAVVLLVAFISSVLWFNVTEQTETIVAGGEATPIKIEDKQPKIQVAEAKIVEKKIPVETSPSKDSLLELSKDPMGLKSKSPKTSIGKAQEEIPSMLVGIKDFRLFDNKPLNAYELGLNVMMPQYMNNNLLKQELLASYRVIHEEEKRQKGLSLAVVESGVKLVNFFSRDEMKLQKYYNTDGEVIGYDLKGENLEVNRRASGNLVGN